MAAELSIDCDVVVVGGCAGFSAAVSAAQSGAKKVKWDPAIRDGLSTQSKQSSLKVPKSNRALTIDEGPFMAVKVGCGVTFTFGGLEVDPNTAGVISNLTGRTVPGVFCAGEMVGALFYENYPGGSGLTSGAVFGRKAGIHAAEIVKTGAGQSKTSVSSRL
ncbi:uncharacterized protein PAC_18822 [Phialocephala subalpina]|uniref:FAD-dependent oxidoreductase 2 FAD-binding domain-containing protein n=1 Tax=Phialocephala subalpina TaxID=576137 RepID=A0A1L7XV61_9HELO|nr:uncharacterized protein PAC_18822 [Phialocephala subalpina]